MLVIENKSFSFGEDRKMTEDKEDDVMYDVTPPALTKAASTRED